MIKRINNLMDKYSKEIILILAGAIIGMCLLGFPLIRSGGGFVPKFDELSGAVGKCQKDIKKINSKELVDLSGYVTREEFENRPLWFK